jgi:hypothetical protein
LQSVSEKFGIGWHTLFLMNNSTILNPVDVLPGLLPLPRSQEKNIDSAKLHVSRWPSSRHAHCLGPSL